MPMVLGWVYVRTFNFDPTESANAQNIVAAVVYMCKYVFYGFLQGV